MAILVTQADVVKGLELYGKRNRDGGFMQSIHRMIESAVQDEDVKALEDISREFAGLVYVYATVHTVNLRFTVVYERRNATASNVASEEEYQKAKADWEAYMRDNEDEAIPRWKRYFMKAIQRADLSNTRKLFQIDPVLVYTWRQFAGGDEHAKRMFPTFRVVPTLTLEKGGRD